MAPFKVIIVGGSIAGLALANIFEQYGIDYIVLEKYECIAPQLGAGFAILPNGVHMLDQLGCYEALVKNNVPVNSMIYFDERGTQLGSRPDIGEWMEKTFGYKMRFMDRQQVIQGLWDNLRDRSKVHTSCGVVKIVCDADGVAVETVDGSVFHGDIVVGADGVHSKVRLEMRRIAAEGCPGKDLFPEKDSFKCSFRGLFGISKAPEGILQDQVVKNFRKGRSYLCTGGPDNTLYWLLMFKNEKETRGRSVPQYTEEDRQKLVEMCQNDLLRPGMTFGDIYKKQIKSALVPLEEGVLKTCFYKRMVLVGDSWHKVNPLAGLGGNNAIMSAAFLANQLKDLLIQPDVSPDEGSLQTAFRNYQESRETQTKMIAEMTSSMQHMEALDTPILKYIQLHMVPTIGTAAVINSLSQWYTVSTPLRYLPLPSRRGLLPYEYEVKIKPKTRSNLANAVWILMLVLVVSFHYPLQQRSTPAIPVSEDTGSSKEPQFVQLAQLHFHASVAIVNTIICIESYRPFFVTRLISNSLPFGIAALVVGWEFITPIWFALFIMATTLKHFYFPSARRINLGVGLSLWPAFFLTYGPIFIYSLVTYTVSDQWWMLSHAALPLMIQLSRKLIARLLSPAPDSSGKVYGEQDARHLRGFMRMATWIPFIELSSYKYRFYRILYDIYDLGYRQAVTGDATKKMLLDVAILLFIVFVFWDLHRVGIRTPDFWLNLAYGLFLTLGLGPAPALGELWGLREELWEEARKRETTE